MFSNIIYRPGCQTSSSDSNSTFKHCANWVIGETVYEIAKWHSCTFHNAGGLNSANFPHSWSLSVVFLLHSCQKLRCTRSSAPGLLLCGTIDLLTKHYIITQLSHLVGMSIQNTKQFQDREKKHSHYYTQLTRVNTWMCHGQLNNWMNYYNLFLYLAGLLFVLLLMWSKLLLGPLQCPSHVTLEEKWCMKLAYVPSGHRHFNLKGERNPVTSNLSHLKHIMCYSEICPGIRII